MKKYAVSGLIVMALALGASVAAATLVMVSWVPPSRLAERRSHILRVQVLDYGKFRGRIGDPYGPPVVGEKSPRPNALYGSMTVRVMAAIKGECQNDTITLYHDNFSHPSDYIVDNRYVLGREYLLFLEGCGSRIPLGYQYCRFEYTNGMVTGCVYGDTVSTVSIAQFMKILGEAGK